MRESYFCAYFFCVVVEGLRDMAFRVSFFFFGSVDGVVVFLEYTRLETWYFSDGIGFCFGRVLVLFGEFIFIE